MTTNNTRKVNEHSNLGTLQQGDVVLGERVSGTTGLFTVPVIHTPGGSDTQLQYNNDGAFGGISEVTYDGSNVTITSGLNVQSYIDISEISDPGAPDANTARLNAVDQGGFSVLTYQDSAGFNQQLSRDNVLVVRNNSGSTLSKGTWVYITGSTGVYPTVDKALADSISTLPVIGAIVADTSDASFGQVMLQGDLRGLDTSAFSDGDILYLSDTVAGATTATSPSGTGVHAVRVGVVIKSGSGSSGIISIYVDSERRTPAEIKTAYESNADTNAYTDAEQTKVSNLSGTNTGDQTSIVGITGTKAEFDTAVTDGNILYVGDITQYTDELAQDAVGGIVDASLNYVDGTPLLQRAALTGDVTASAGSNATSIDSTVKQSIRDLTPTAGFTGTGAEVRETSPTFAGTSGIIVPSGTTAQRPSADSRWLRYNSDLDRFEGRASSGWKALAPTTAGSITFTLSGTTTAGSPTGSFTGTYNQSGSLIYVTGVISITSLDVMAGNLKIDGLPFTVRNGSNRNGMVVVTQRSNFTNDFPVVGHVVNNTTTMLFSRMDQDSVSLTISDLSNTTSFQINAVYHIL